MIMMRTIVLRVLSCHVQICYRTFAPARRPMTDDEKLKKANKKNQVADRPSEELLVGPQAIKRARAPPEEKEAGNADGQATKAKADGKKPSVPKHLLK